MRFNRKIFHSSALLILVSAASTLLCFVAFTSNRTVCLGEPEKRAEPTASIVTVDSPVSERLSAALRSRSEPARVFGTHLSHLRPPSFVPSMRQRCESKLMQFGPVAENVLAKRYAKLLDNKTVFFAANLFDNANILADWVEQLLHVVSAFRLRSGIFVSLFENGSVDLTKGFLASLDIGLTLMGVPHHIELDHSPFVDFEKERINRIDKLQKIRNTAMRPLYEHLEKGKTYDRVFFLNDVLFCAWDVFEVLHQSFKQAADITCPLDVSRRSSSLRFYDTWVSLLHIFPPRSHSPAGVAGCSWECVQITHEPSCLSPAVAEQSPVIPTDSGPVLLERNGITEPSSVRRGSAIQDGERIGGRVPSIGVLFAVQGFHQVGLEQNGRSAVRLRPVRPRWRRCREGSRDAGGRNLWHLQKGGTDRLDRLWRPFIPKKGSHE